MSDELFTPIHSNTVTSVIDEAQVAMLYSRGLRQPPTPFHSEATWRPRSNCSNNGLAWSVRSHG